MRARMKQNQAKDETDYWFEKEANECRFKPKINKEIQFDA